MTKTLLCTATLLFAAASFGLPGSAAPQTTGADTRRDPAAAEKKPKRTWHAKIGQLAPDFELKDSTGQAWKLSDNRGRLVVLEWFNPRCPVVQKAHAEGGALEKLGNGAREKGIVWVAVNSNAPGKPGSSLRENETARGEIGIEYPVLLDETGWVGRMYEATTTPQMFIIDKDGTLAYAGAHDDASAPNRGNGPVNNLVEQALATLSRGGELAEPRTRSYGCSVKYDGKAKLGMVAPDFELTGLEGESFHLSAHRGRYLVLEWFNPQCPVVKRAHDSGGPLESCAAQVARDGVVWAAVNSGGPGKQGASRDTNVEAARRWSLKHPILLDSSGEVGKTYGARTTPQMFVIDPRGVIIYTGSAQARDGGPNFITQAIEEQSAGKPVSVPQTESYGCGVKYAN